MSNDSAVTVVHLAASPFYGGPERQMLGLAEALRPDYRSVFLSFAERGLARAFLDRVREAGFPSYELCTNAPHLFRAAREVAEYLRREHADILSCNGYKPDIVGWLAARQVGVPVVCVAHGWTAATRKVACYELADRWVMRWADCTVCVSEAMASRVCKAGVPVRRTVVIRNAIRTDAFEYSDPAYGDLLHGFFTRPPGRIIVAAGRLSPEKGFDQLVEAAALLRRDHPEFGFVLFGDGPQRQSLADRIVARQLQQKFILAGFRTDVERYLPHADLVVNSSFTEGLPVVVLEALAAGVPVVATAVGGTPEIIEDGVHGLLVPAGQPELLARGIGDALANDDRRRTMGSQGRKRVQAEFTFAAQGRQYRELFRKLMVGRVRCNGALETGKREALVP